MPGHCTECGGPLVMTKRSEVSAEQPPEPEVDEEKLDLAAQDVDEKEGRSVKAATLVCGRCGAQMAMAD